MSRRITVIGAGPGGYQAALRAASLGARVTVVEQAAAGGTCLHWGCIPSKTIKATSDALELTGRLAELGISGPHGFKADLSAIMARKTRVIALLQKGIEKLLQSWDIDLIKGRARVVSPKLVEVSSEAGRLIEGEAVIVASGSRQAELPGLIRDGLRVLGSDDALMLSQVPQSLLVVGGGVVGCEFAAIFAGLGCPVTLVEMLDRVLPIPGLDPDSSRLIARELKKRGVTVKTNTMVSGAVVSDKGVSVELVPADGDQDSGQRAEFQQVLLAGGRVPAGSDLGLAELGVEVDPRGAVQVDPGFATARPDIYAVGDVLGPKRPMLAHVAGAEGEAAAANALGGSQSLDYGAIPQVAYTSPEVAWAGLSLAQAQEQGLDAEPHVFSLRTLGRSQASGELSGQVKLVVEAQSGRLLGAQIVGAGASEMIHECALALRLKATVADLASTVHAHPSLSEAVREAALAAMGQGLHSPRPGGRR